MKNNFKYGNTGTILVLIVDVWFLKQRSTIDRLLQM